VAHAELLGWAGAWLQDQGASTLLCAIAEAIRTPSASALGAPNDDTACFAAAAVSVSQSALILWSLCHTLHHWYSMVFTPPHDPRVPENVSTCAFLVEKLDRNRREGARARL